MGQSSGKLYSVEQMKNLVEEFNKIENTGDMLQWLQKIDTPISQDDGIRFVRSYCYIGSNIRTMVFMLVYQENQRVQHNKIKLRCIKKLSQR